ncbi:hypothetical protein F5884DRAFT_787818 [Xylogone sp. PMI_703]|nr:hypothetical protein F5884DRAFT_787818 [Xylogone sp. PMI_703]
MSIYGSPGVSDLSNVSRAQQACMTCRKQKRKCNKALPACSLCERMNRHCDYSEVTPPPSHEDFNALRMKLAELEARLNGGGQGFGINSPTPYPTPATTGLTADTLGPPVGFAAPPQDAPWQGIQNSFPVIAFLDSETFKYGRIAVPKPNIEIPVDVLELLGDGPSIQAALSDYFATIHKWFPIVSPKRLTRNMVNPLWEAGPDLALLFLCMKLITSRPQDGLGCSQNPIYLSAKRFISLMESSGMVSLIVLQANLMITLYEYGQAIYPAAWMSSGWSIRYGNMLGVNTFGAAQLLGRPATWTEQEERKRTWWGVLVVDRMISTGGQSHILTNQEPRDSDPLPVDDTAWDEGNMTQGILKTLSSPYVEPVAPFPRLCQASHLLGKTFAHHEAKFPSDKEQYDDATHIFDRATSLVQTIQEESASSGDVITLSSALAVAFSSISAICDPYSCPRLQTGGPELTGDAAEAQLRALNGLKRVSQQIQEFSEQLNSAMPLAQDIDKVSPFIMDALYCGAASHAWWVRESGDANSQLSLDSLRNNLRRLGGRWRNAAEYLRILEAQEFTYAVGGAGP